MSMSSSLVMSCTTGIIQIWFEATVEYTCYSFTFISCQYFKTIHLTLNVLSVTFPATFHNSFLIFFHYSPVYSVSSVFCSEKEKWALLLSNSSMLSSDFFLQLCLAFSTPVCPGKLLPGSCSHRRFIVEKNWEKQLW